MGKAKRRNLNKTSNDKFVNLTRKEALLEIVAACNAKNITEDVKDLILLFGFNAEDLLEAGADYEDTISLKAFLG